jgi:pSer/pThr/pTyr-binding forkhead associated (FHA) protein
MGEILITLRNAKANSAPVIKLANGTIAIGRDPTCGIVLSHPSVSRFHAQLAIQGTTISVQDLGSRNGTYVDAQRVDSSPLAVGQKLGVGSVVFAVEVLGPKPGGEAEEDTASVDDALRSDSFALEDLALSVAERRVFDLMLPGHAEKQIARQLGISRHTVHTHVRKIYETLGVRSRAELSALFIKKPQAGTGGTAKLRVPTDH